VYEVTGTLLRYEDSLNSEFGAYKGYIVRCTKNGLEYLNRMVKRSGYILFL